MNIVSPFVDDDKELEIAASQSVSYVLPMIFSEVHVLRSLFVYLTMIARSIVYLPLALLSNIGTPEFKHGFSILVSILISFVVPYIFGFSLESGLKMIKEQSFYKIWALYTLFMIILRFLNRVHKHTHRMIRGAIRENHSILIPTLLHSISNIMMYAVFNIFFGTYLAGIYGKPGLFISACLHIQAVITKKYLPKLLEVPPQFNEPLNRMVLLYAFAHHMSYGDFDSVKLMIIFDYAFTFFRFFLTALTEDSVKVYNVLKFGGKNAFYQFVKNDERPANSITANVPIEAFAVATLFLLTEGSMNFKIIIGGLVLGFATAGSIIITIFAPNTKPALAVEKKEKKEKTEKTEKKEKGADKEESKEKTD